MPKRELTPEQLETRELEHKLMLACDAVHHFRMISNGKVRGASGKLVGKMKRRLRTVIKHANDLGIMYDNY